MFLSSNHHGKLLRLLFTVCCLKGFLLPAGNELSALSWFISISLDLQRCKREADLPWGKFLHIPEETSKEKNAYSLVYEVLKNELKINPKEKCSYIFNQIFFVLMIREYIFLIQTSSSSQSIKSQS